jgi:tRNA G10  N-methylase Trm11
MVYMNAGDQNNDFYFMNVPAFGPLEKIECVYCNRRKTSLIAVQEWFGESFNIVQCDNCRLIYTNPRPTIEWTKRFHDPNSNPLMKVENRDFVYIENSFRVPAYQRLARFLTDQAAPGRKLLDGGCASGEFIRAAKAVGFSACGFDSSAGVVEFVKKKI